jgi:hypothetical protein
VSLPEVNTCTVFVQVKRNSRTTVLFAEGVAHHCDRLHRLLEIHVLAFDRYDAVFVVLSPVDIIDSSCSVFECYLRLAIENNVEKLGLLGLDLININPLDKYGQLICASGFISTS